MPQAMPRQTIDNLPQIEPNVAYLREILYIWGRFLCPECVHKHFAA